MAKSRKSNSGLVKLDTPDAIIVSSMGIKTAKARKSISKRVGIDVPFPVKTPALTWPQIKVYLYMQLTGITNIPPTGNEVELVMEINKTRLERVEEQYTGSTAFFLKDLEKYNPIYSITVNQDSLNDINLFSDNPLLVTLYEHISEPIIAADDAEQIEGDRLSGVVTKMVNGEEVRCRERIAPIAQGVIDILSAFSKSRASHETEILLYPFPNSQYNRGWGTCKTVWHLYTLMPLIKEINFSNMIFITFEGIYNAPFNIKIGSKNLVAELSFRSQFSQFSPGQGVHPITPICTFSRFSVDIIAEQNANIKWEAARNIELIGSDALGLQTGTKIHLHKLFRRLLGTNGVDFKFEEIDINRDEVVYCNAMHRYVISKELNTILENLTGSHEQELIVRIYREGARDEVLLEGAFDRHIFLYPSVNAVRFAIALTPPDNGHFETISPKGQKMLRKSQGKKRVVTIDDPLVTGDTSTSTMETIFHDRPTFAILSICLLTPITETAKPVSQFEAGAGARDPLTSCQRSDIEGLYVVEAEDAYREFDDLMQIIIDYIIKNNLKSPDEAKDYFCCQSSNVLNRIMKLIGVDFNQRYPTKDNIQFVRLMPVVYEELVARCYEMIKNCGEKEIPKCMMQNAVFAGNECQRLFSLSKYMYEIGDTRMGDFFMGTINVNCANDVEVPFYQMLYKVEKREFANAKTFVDNIRPERFYFVHLLMVYIEYMESLESEDETVRKEAEENLFENLRKLSKRYPQRNDVLILLHCMYKNCNYLAGIDYTRWRFENQYDIIQKSLLNVPKSLWKILLDYDIELSTTRNQAFHASMELFLNLGAYAFAEIIFLDIAAQCSELERFMYQATFKILMKRDEVDSVSERGTRKQFKTEGSASPETLKAFEAQVNGNIEFHRGNQDAAMEHYKSIINMGSLYEFHPFEVSLLRYAHYMLQEGDYDAAIAAYETCCVFDSNCVVAAFGMGRALYKLGRLEDAELRFSNATECGFHIPDVWAYLALINLKLGHNFKALECWKYAKLNPESTISDEVLLELKEINVNDIRLYVDKPAQF